MSKYYYLLYEDVLSYYVIIKVITKYAPSIVIGNSQNCHGFGNIKAKIDKWNNAAKNGLKIIIVTDLDDYTCPIELINKWFSGDIHHNLVFRIAIREIESWVLADDINFSKFLGVSNYNIIDPDSIDDPKKYLFKLTKKSRYTNIRNDILPIDVYANIGPNYNDRLGLFVQNNWDINNAQKKSKSLDRMIKALIRANNG